MVRDNIGVALPPEVPAIAASVAFTITPAAKVTHDWTAAINALHPKSVLRILLKNECAALGSLVNISSSFEMQFYTETSRRIST